MTNVQNGTPGSQIKYIDAGFPEPTFEVYQLFCIIGSGNGERQFFIDHNLKETKATYFNTYEFSFNVLNIGLPDRTTLADVN